MESDSTDQWWCTIPCSKSWLKANRYHWSIPITIFGNRYGWMGCKFFLHLDLSNFSTDMPRPSTSLSFRTLHWLRAWVISVPICMPKQTLSELCSNKNSSWYTSNKKPRKGHYLWRSAQSIILSSALRVSTLRCCGKK